MNVTPKIMQTICLDTKDSFYVAYLLLKMVIHT